MEVWTLTIQKSTMIPPSWMVLVYVERCYRPQIPTKQSLIETFEFEKESCIFPPPLLDAYNYTFENVESQSFQFRICEINVKNFLFKILTLFKDKGMINRRYRKHPTYIFNPIGPWKVMLEILKIYVSASLWILVQNVNFQLG